jgi:DNA repair exonuclease SbcCD ATPase subunit
MDPELARLKPDEVALKTKIINESKEELEQWARKRFWIVTILVAILVPAITFIGAQALVESAMRPRIQAEEDRVWSQFSSRFAELETRSSTLESKLIDAVAEAKSSTQDIKRISEQARNAQDTVQKLIDQTNTMQAQLTKTLEEIRKLGQGVAAVQASAEQARRETSPLDRNEQAKIRIKESPTPTGTTTNTGAMVTRLTYSVEVQGDNATRILSGIDRVLYVLDPKWFTNDQMDRRDPSDGFSFSINVWGTTNVKAMVYMRGLTEPIVFEGLMNLSSVSYLDRK